MSVSAALLVLAFAGPVTTSFNLRGKTLDLRLYGERGDPPVVLASGDGGWIHLGPRAAEVLAASGYFVVGLDTRQYLSVFTTRRGMLGAADVAGDFKALIDYAAQGGPAKPVLMGVSEGAGLAVLAAVDPAVKAEVSGVVGLGLPDRNELAWRFRDAMIYLTHKAADEPSFSVLEIVNKLAPLPLAQLQATHDEFVPLAEAQRVHEQAAEPKRMWVIDAANHRFSDNADEFARRLIEAVTWVAAAAPR